MSKQLIIILILIVIIVASATMWFLSPNDTLQEDGLSDAQPSTSFPISGTFPISEDDYLSTNRNGDDISSNNGFISNDTTLETDGSLRELASGPVAGFVILLQDGESVVRYTERATGHTNDVGIDGGAVVRRTNTTIPRVYNATWDSEGKTVLLNTFLDGGGQGTIYATLTEATSTSASTGGLNGLTLPRDSLASTITHDGRSVFYLVRSGDEATGVVATMAGVQRETGFKTPLLEWLASSAGAGEVALTSKASASAPGVLLFVDTRTGAQEQVLVGTMGLSTLVSPDGKRVLYSRQTENKETISAVYDRETKASVLLPVVALAEKCTWSPKNKDILYCAAGAPITGVTLPDDWYMGLYSFTDYLWYINLASDDAEPVLLPRRELDMISLRVDEEENNLAFIDKKSGALMRVKLNNY